MVDELAKKHVDGIKTVLEAGSPAYPFVRMDPALIKAIAEEAHKFNLPVVCHTGNARDVEDAVNAGVDGIEHGSMTDVIPEAVFAKMKQAGITFDPTLDVVEAFTMLAQGKTEMLDRTLVQQVGPKKLLESTKKFLQSPDGEKMRAGLGEVSGVDGDLQSESGRRDARGSDSGHRNRFRESDDLPWSGNSSRIAAMG